MNLLGSLRNRLLSGLVLLLLLFLAIAVIGVVSLRSLNRAVTAEIGIMNQGASLANLLVNEVTGQIRTAEAYLVTPGDSLAREFLRQGDSTHAANRRYRLVPGLTTDDQALLNRMELQHARIEVAYGQAHVLLDLGRGEAARNAARVARAPTDSLVADVAALGANQQARSAAQVASLQDRAREREAVVWLLLAMAILLGSGTAFLTVRSIEAPLDRLIDAARRFGAGDLRPADLGDMPRELATLAHAMGTMGARLRSMIDATIRESQGISLSAGDLSAMSEEVAASSHEIVKSVSGVTSGATAQVREVRGAEALLGQLLEASAQDVAATERVLALGESTRTLASGQGADLTTAGSSLAGLRTTLQQASAEARALLIRLDAVQEAAEFAATLSAQSDVLALNASVEAARAGDGGFHAVAAETRHLADSSRDAAARVTVAVADVRDRTAEVLAQLQAAAAAALATEGTVERSSVALQEIGRLVEAMRDIATRVARSATESRAIAARFAELRGHLESIAQGNVQTSESVSAAATQQSEATDDIATSAAGLLEASERLAALVAGFTT